HTQWPCAPPILTGHPSGRDAKAWLGGGSADALAYPDGTVDQLAKRVVVHIVEALEVQAALSGLVRAQPRQHRLVPVLELADQIDDQAPAARRETCQRRVALLAPGVP